MRGDIFLHVWLVSELTFLITVPLYEKDFSDFGLINICNVATRGHKRNAKIIANCHVYS